MAHCIVPAAEEILDKEFLVLDHGFVRLVDYLGSDERIVQAARVSYGEGTKTYRQDKGLISYLLRNEHTSPFEQVNFTFHVKMPIFVARQWVRHRTARINEISGRYSILKDEAYLPQPHHVNLQSEDNKQGRASEPVPPEMAEKICGMLAEDQRRAFASYHNVLEQGVARELARINLPLSAYTEWYWQMDLHNLLRFLMLRTDAHAQYEIRVYADVMLDIVEKVCPMTVEAFREHTLGGRKFSASEFAALKEMLAGKENPLTGRAREQFEAKLK
ncbi:FAD-dependent thymidylate synthase [Parasphaerochaeta coccoides]|uniref:Flavin-dependent thymidylate synthase n=1 Tax=Parasphaerochaeta coccoides (strain ATCC BAA-1237 / DSM 17374 / SPN1) TaxID=760011 RepID=F4GJP9_PARC1|nr:FAD-dependent thymidylate synthase [Parasphaerochaeta coccoides]AEC02796.1 Thymidylate synthase thyX [Parasphaerochaeta coccoides DSM 17374]